MALYKYVPSKLWGDILRDGFIRFTQPASLNDPWEMKPYIEKLMTDEIWESDVRAKAMEQLQSGAMAQFRGASLLKTLSEEIWKQGNRQQRRAQTPLQIEQRLKVAQNNGIDIQKIYEGHYLKIFNHLVDEAVTRQKELVSAIPDILNKTVGVLSLTQDPIHHIMWSHYADTFSGFVIAFDENHNFFTTRRSDEDELSGLHKIDYKEEMPSIKAFIDYSEEHLSTIAAKLFFTKGIQWAYEREWRMIKPLKEANKIIKNPAGNIHLFALPSTCITGVIFGHKMNPDVRREIIELLTSNEKYEHHVNLLETVLSERSYDIELKPVES